MSAIAPLVVNDGVATPVSHTFGVVGIDTQGVAKWADRVSGIALGFPTVTFSSRAPNKDSRNYKITRKIVVPILEQTSASTSTGIQPAPTLSYNLIQTSEWILPERSTLAQRQDLIAFAKNIDALAFFTDAIKNFETVY